MKYKKVVFRIVFDRKVKFYTSPAFVFRSVLGNELRKLSCFFPGRKCEECSLNATCVYADFFESHIAKNNNVIGGRNRASHPFVLFSDIHPNSTVKEMNLDITLFGKGMEYLPYLYSALNNAGSKGILKERIPFKVIDIFQCNNSILKSSNEIYANIEPEEWIYDADKAILKNREIYINFLSPLRMKVGGRYTASFEYSDLLKSCSRRIKILESFYGDDELNFLEIEGDYESKLVIHKDMRWIDLTYFSSRQRKALKLGGVIGKMKISGDFLKGEISILQGCEIFHTGKNTSFGLGKMALTIK